MAAVDVVPPSPEKMFKYFFVARRVEDESKTGFRVEIVDCFPKPSEELVREHPKVDVFCFPEASKGVVSRSRRFAFTLTDAAGGWLYGFCIRVERRSRGIPDCLCILSKYPYFDMFYEVLCYDQLQYGSGYKPTVARTLYEQPFPPPGSRFCINTPNHRFYVTRPSDAYPLSDASVQDFHNTFGVGNMLELLLAILEEQRVLFVGDDLDLVTGCIHALTALLFPLVWGYPFVPVLPPSMIDAVCSPTPFIMGIHAELLKPVLKLPTENIIIADTRNGTVTGLAERGRLVFPNSKVKDKMKEVMEKKGKSKVERTHEAISVMAEFFAAIFGKLRAYPTVVQAKNGDERSDFDDSLFLNCFAADKRLYPFVHAITKTHMYPILKDQSDNWSAGKPDTFAEKCASKYPDLWEPYSAGKDFLPAKKESSQSGLFARFGRAKEKVKKEFDKKVRKGSNQAGSGSQAASPVSSTGDRASSVERTAAGGTSSASLPPTTWLNEVENPKTVMLSQYADFPALHDSFDPFVVHGGNVYGPSVVQHSDPFDSLGAIAAAPAHSPRSAISDVVVRKINGRVGCSYRRNEVAEVQPGGGAHKAGITPGCKMLALDGAIMEGKESHEVKAMLDSASKKFVLTILMPPGKVKMDEEPSVVEKRQPQEPKDSNSEEKKHEQPTGEDSNGNPLSLEDIFAAPVTSSPSPNGEASEPEQPVSEEAAVKDEEFPF